MISFWLQIGLSNALVATALVAVALVVARRLRPQWAFALWLLVLAKLLVPPLWNAPLGSLRAWLPAPPGAMSADQGAPFDEAEASDPADRAVHLPSAGRLPRPSQNVTSSAASGAEESIATRLLAFDHGRATGVLFVAWALGTGVWIGLALRRVRQFMVLLGQSRLAPAELQAETATLARRIGLRRVPAVRLVSRRVPPLVWALVGKPTILLPEALLRALSPAQRTALVMHELVHLRRRDHLAKLLELAALAVYWWLPPAWLARRHLERAAEHCCDAEVIAQAPYASRAYAECLLAVLDFLAGSAAPVPLGASGFSQFGHVSRRIEMILSPHVPHRSSWPARLALVALGMTLLPLSVRTLWAEPAAAPDQSAKSTSADTPNAAEETDEVLDRYWDDLVARSIDPLVAAVTERKAAARQFEALLKAYESDTVTIDPLLEAQRRLTEAEMSLARAACQLGPTRGRTGRLREAELAVANRALRSARRAWKVAYSRRDAHGANGEAVEEAQAREQYYLFKTRMAELLEKHQQDQEQAAYFARNLDPLVAAIERQIATDPRQVATILGPFTSGGPAQALDPPSDDDVLRAVEQLRAQHGKSVVGGPVRIVKEKIADYTDPPRVYPLVGPTQLHHTLYKCTLYSGGAKQIRPDVVYVSQNHYHQSDEATP